LLRCKQPPGCVGNMADSLLRPRYYGRANKLFLFTKFDENRGHNHVLQGPTPYSLVSTTINSRSDAPRAWFKAA